MSDLAAVSNFLFRGLCRRSLILAAVALTIAGVAVAAQSSDTLIVREGLGITLPRRTVSSVLASTPLDAWFAGGRTHAPKERGICPLR